MMSASPPRLAFRFELIWQSLDPDANWRDRVEVCRFEDPDDPGRARKDAIRAWETACRGDWVTTTMSSPQVSPLHVLQNGRLLAGPLRPRHHLADVVSHDRGRPPPPEIADAVARAYARDNAGASS